MHQLATTPHEQSVSVMCTTCHWLVVKDRAMYDRCIGWDCERSVPLVDMFALVATGFEMLVNCTEVVSAASRQCSVAYMHFL